MKYHFYLRNRNQQPKKLSTILIKNVMISTKTFSLIKALKRSLRIIYKKEHCLFSNFVPMRTFNPQITKNNILQFQSISPRATCKINQFSISTILLLSTQCQFFNQVFSRELFQIIIKKKIP